MKYQFTTDLLKRNYTDNDFKGIDVDKLNTAVVISGCWPGQGKGYEIACNASLKFYTKKYLNVIYFGPRDEIKNPSFINNFPNVTFIDSNFDRASMPLRFLRSLLSSYPAICCRFIKARNYILKEIERLNVSHFDVIYEDIPTTYFMEYIRDRYPKARHIVRSHNVVYKGFSGMAKQGGLIKRVAWSIELHKILKQERKCFEKSNLFITISTDDVTEYRRLGINADLVLGVFLPYNVWQIPKNSPHNFIHIGTADLRKGNALKLFLDNVWSQLHELYPDLKFYLAGTGTEKFNNPEIGILGLGRIKDEVELFTQGAIFINPQLEGSGVKIKSLVALSYNKCLVTTTIGVEGIDLVNGNEAVICGDFEKMLRELCLLLDSNGLIESIADNGNKKYKNNYTEEAFMSEAYRVWSKL
ncbi:TPA: glycosyltransferase [Citrobacter braakii]|uniref:glycosyltransferase n=1 Tax=Citrobacter TaxID=544 RepID=UPI000BADF3AB|nr:MULTISPECIES: glycosyltransferase [Citrobacter]MBS6005228.1 glycosyltransferase [Citrobacter sp.]MEB0939152.1 glycosyltransferase [Citrobacter braakii]MEB0944363.1 glycosyltransferase [Citrobacter braakii]MEB0969170.1 glycosyltransferase [Citrobacter braakii]MEB0993568.1 glycosyltransferase [Citrobacter braakii]